MRRNLIYHLYPAVDNQVWTWNLDFVRQYFHYFDRIIIGVAHDAESVSPTVISDYLSDYRHIEFVLAKNNQNKGELTTLPNMLDMVSSMRDDEVTFYAHAKGVSHSGARLQAVKNWISGMYEFNLPPSRIDHLWNDHACVGAFKRGGPGDSGVVGNKHGWHYSGNFWWVKHSALFALDWQHTLRGRRHAAENFLGQLLPCELAACSGMRGAYPLYSARAWKGPHGSIFKAMRTNSSRL